MPHRVPVPFPHRLGSPSPSTTAIGTAFENHTVRYLNDHLHMSLRRTGGSGDEGIDFRGWWFIPPDVKRERWVRKPTALRKIDRTTSRGVLASDTGQLPRVGFRKASPNASKSGKMNEEEEDADRSGDDGDIHVDEDGVRLRRLRVIGQCKAEAKALGSRPVRELEGVMGHLHGMFASSPFSHMTRALTDK
jgi:hypothetical protein